MLSLFYEDGKPTEIPTETTIGHFSSLSPLQSLALSASLLIADDNADMREYLRKLFGKLFEPRFFTRLQRRGIAWPKG